MTVEKLKSVSISIAKFTSILILLITIYLFIVSVFRYHDEELEHIVKNKALFMTHCTKFDKLPWYVCNDIWSRFSYDFKYEYNVEATKY